MTTSKLILYLVVVFFFTPIASGNHTVYDSLLHMVVQSNDADQRNANLKELVYFRKKALAGPLLHTYEISSSPIERYETALLLVRFYSDDGNADSTNFWLHTLELNPLTARPENHRRYELAKGSWLSKSGDHQKAQRLYELHRSHYFNLVPSDENIEEYLQYMVRLSIIYRSNGILDSAAMCSQRAMINLKLSTNPILRYHVVREMSRVYNRLSQNGKALELLKGTDSVTNHYGIPFDLAYYHYYMGKYLLELEDYRDALHHQEEAIVLCRKYGIEDFWGVGLINMSVAYHGLGEIQSGIQALEQARNWYARFQPNNHVRQFIILLNMANHYSDMGDLIAANTMYNQAETLCSESHFDQYRGILLNNKSRLYSRLYRNSDALSCNLEAERLLSPNDYGQLAFLYETRETIYRRLGNLKRAYDAHIVLDSVRNLIKTEKEQELLTFHRITLEQEEYKQELIRNELNHERILGRRKSVIITLVIVLFALSGALLAYYFHTIKQKHKTNYQLTSLREAATKAQLEALRSQINPHFIFNALNTFQYFIRIEALDKALNYLSTFSNLLREKIFTSSQEFVSVNHELDLISKYVKIETMRLKHGLKFHTVIDPGIDANAIGMPPMVMQPLVENAIWHGAGQVEGGQLTVHVHINKQLIITIEDNGPGFEMKSVDDIPKKSFGIKNVIDRLKNLSILYNVSTGLEISKNKSAENTGTVQTLTLPFINLS